MSQPPLKNQITKPRPCESGKNTLNFFKRLISSCEAIFGSAVLQIPIDRTGSDSKNAHTQACHSSTEPFYRFAAEPHVGGSTRSEDAYS